MPAPALVDFHDDADPRCVPQYVAAPGHSSVRQDQGFPSDWLLSQLSKAHLKDTGAAMCGVGESAHGRSQAFSYGTVQVHWRCGLTANDGLQQCYETVCPDILWNEAMVSSCPKAALRMALHACAWPRVLS
eukprot:1195385-Pyramimonas_sp.AAC.1